MIHRPAGRLDDRGDLVERHGEHVVEHEGEPLRWAERIEDHEQREADRVGEERLVLGICPVGPVDDRVGDTDADRLLAPHVA